MDAERKVYDYVTAMRLIPAGSTVVLAVSGGIDSMVMAHLLVRLRHKLCFTPVIACFDHCLREESAAEVAFVARFAAGLDVPFFSAAADISQLAVGDNVENVARRERYAFLRRVAARYPAALIATAHHRGDQAETVLLHLLRGSGTDGLSAIAPRQGDVIRPLLCLNRAEIALYAAAVSLSWCEDRSNQSDRYLRNRVRHELLPQLCAYNPQIEAALNDTAAICRGDEELLRQLTEQAFERGYLPQKQALAAAEFDSLPLALRRRVLRRAFQCLAAPGETLSFAQTEAALQLRDEQQTALPGGWIAYRRENLLLARRQPPLPRHDEVWPLQADGSWHTLGDWGWSYCAGGVWNSPEDGFLLPAAQAAGAFWRTRRDGDRVPSAAGGPGKKVKDILIDAHIPAWRRCAWPLLCHADEICWIPQLWRPKRQLFAGDILIKVSFHDKMN